MTRVAAVLFVVVATACPAAEPWLHDFDGVASLAAALRKDDLDAGDDAAALGITVKGPSKPDQIQQPLQAEVRRPLEHLDGVAVIAGLQADRRVVREGTARWVGGVGLAAEHDGGRDALEFRTSVGQMQQAGILGVELGPRIERRLPGGLVFFLDGKAEARSLSAAGTGGQPLPGQATDGLGIVGLAGRTGLVR